MNERILALRKKLNLSQTEFGKRIGLTASGVSNIEVGIREVQERHIKLILSEFPSVNEKWLRTGEGEMLIDETDKSVAEIVKKFSFPEICAKLLYTYDALDEERQKAVLDYARAFIASMIRDDAAQVADAIAGPSKEDGPARQQLADALNQELSPTSPPGENETA